MIDLRSDTVTRPTPDMLRRMATAELGDDGRGDDPTVAALEREAATRMGKEAALFVPSGTMGNQIAILTHTGRAGEVVGEASNHVFRSEMGGLSLIAGLYPRPLPGRRGAVDLDALRQSLNPPGVEPNHIGTALVTVESSHNWGGGAVLPLAHLADVQRLAVACQVPVHLDGARIFNAAVALGVPARDIAAHAQSVMFCISKGLSAPVGSLLCGPADFIRRARGFRRLLGGNMRQAGVLAACGLVALEDMVERLAEDHAHARALAAGIAAFAPDWVDPASVETNIVMVRPERDRGGAAAWCARLAAAGVATSPASADTIRLVTHRHIGAGEVECAVAVFKALHNAGPHRG